MDKNRESKLESFREFIEEYLYCRDFSEHISRKSTISNNFVETFKFIRKEKYKTIF